jgi:hypothetical protein
VVVMTFGDFALYYLAMRTIEFGVRFMFALVML